MRSTGIWEMRGRGLVEIKLRPHKDDPWLQAVVDRKLQAVGLFCLSGPLSVDCPAKFLWT